MTRRKVDFRELRKQWVDSPLRALSLVLAGLVFLVVVFLGLSPYILMLIGQVEQCEQTSTEVIHTGGGEPRSTTTTDEETCSPYKIPTDAMWVGLALFGVLVLIEVGTLLPGLTIETPLGKISHQPISPDDLDEQATSNLILYQNNVRQIGARQDEIGGHHPPAG